MSNKTLAILGISFAAVAIALTGCSANHGGSTGSASSHSAVAKPARQTDKPDSSAKISGIILAESTPTGGPGDTDLTVQVMNTKTGQRRTIARPGACYSPLYRQSKVFPDTVVNVE